MRVHSSPVLLILSVSFSLFLVHIHSVSGHRSNSNSNYLNPLRDPLASSSTTNNKKRRRQQSIASLARTLPETAYSSTTSKATNNLLDEHCHSLETRGGQTTTKIMADTSSNTEGASSPLTKLRRTIFPIYGEEVKKFLLLGSIKFFIIMALTLTRDTKDTLVVTQCGAEAIAFLKVCQNE